MLIKRYSGDGKTCQVTFTLPAHVHAKTTHLYGEFTEWEDSPLSMIQGEDGSFAIEVALKAGKEYRFRYLLDGKRWENDWAADDYVPNAFGTQDSVVRV